MGNVSVYNNMYSIYIVRLHATKKGEIIICYHY